MEKTIFLFADYLSTNELVRLSMVSKSIRKAMISELETIAFLKKKNLFEIFREPIHFPRKNLAKKRKLDPMTNSVQGLFQIWINREKMKFHEIIKDSVEIFEEIRLAFNTSRRSFVYDTEKEIDGMMMYIDYISNYISKNKKSIRFTHILLYKNRREEILKILKNQREFIRNSYKDF